MNSCIFNSNTWEWLFSKIKCIMIKFVLIIIFMIPFKKSLFWFYQFIYFFIFILILWLTEETIQLMSCNETLYYKYK